MLFVSQYVNGLNQCTAFARSASDFIYRSWRFKWISSCFRMTRTSSSLISTSGSVRYILNRPMSMGVLATALKKNPNFLLILFLFYH